MLIECTDNNSVEMLLICIPEGTEFIPMEAFRGNRNLVSVHIPDSVRNIGVSAFSECSRLISVTIETVLPQLMNLLFPSVSA